ncbi:MAG TPA: YggT family protein [Candidatus Krumholzibacteriaceae bacterium]
MDYFVSEPIGLIIAVLNTVTFITIVYVFVKAVEERSRLLQVLDRVYTPLLAPLRRILPAWKLDIASIILAAVLQLVAFYIKRRWQ